jgi:predicted permease
MAYFVAEVRFALRLLGKSPILTLVSVVSLALGIGATTAVFSLIDRLLLRPLPVLHASEELVGVLGTHAGTPEQFYSLSWADYLDYAGHREMASGLAASADCELSLTHNGPAERVSALAVSANYFAVLGLNPARGRLFLPGDETTQIAVLGYDLWKRRFGAAAAVIGSAITLNGKSVTVVGIAPKGFEGTDLGSRRDIWLPLGSYSNIAAGVFAPFTGKQDRKQEWLAVIGRLPAEMSSKRAQSAFSAVAKGLASAYPETNAGKSVRLLPLTELALGQGNRPLFQRFVVRLLAVMALVLAVAAINVAGLLLARGLSRRREIAIRLSLGASRMRLVQQLFIEGLVLGLLGAIAGVGVALAGLPLLERLELPVALAIRDLQLSGRVLGFGLLVSFASCLVFALVPALQSVRVEVMPALRGEAPRGRRVRFGLREMLVGFQMALAFLILMAAGLMFRTWSNLRSIAPGFEPARVLVTTLDLDSAGYQSPRVVPFYSDLLERLRLLPGVQEASMASALPVMGGDLEVNLTVTPEGEQPPLGGTDGASPSVRHVLVGSHYFRTVGMKILQGRDFGPEDDLSGGAVIINQTAARRLWPGRDALGRRLRLAQTKPPFTVVGVVADSTYASLKEKRVPCLYLSHAQSEKSFIGGLLAPQMTLLVRTAGEPRHVLGAVRETIRALDPYLPVFRTTTLDDLLTSTVGVERQAAALYSGLALTAVALALLGLYGVLTHAVVERTREIGVRVACGATLEEVRRLVLRRSAFLAVCGVAAGFAIGVPASRIVASQLYGVRVYDPATWLLTVLFLVSAALLVSAAPARRAAKIDPVRALRYN